MGSRERRCAPAARQRNEPQHKGEDQFNHLCIISDGNHPDIVHKLTAGITIVSVVCSGSSQAFQQVGKCQCGYFVLRQSQRARCGKQEAGQCSEPGCSASPTTSQQVTAGSAWGEPPQIPLPSTSSPKPGHEHSKRAAPNLLSTPVQLGCDDQTGPPRSRKEKLLLLNKIITAKCYC